MKPSGLPRVFLAAVLLLTAHFAAAEVPVPPLKARVTDLTSTLSADQVRALEQKLAALEARKGSQVAVLLVPTTQPEAIEQFSIRVVDQWKLGRKDVDDGVLLLIAKNDRKLRIEVGRGLEGAIPDAYAKRIIEEEITPRFKQGDFAGGIDAGVARITKLIDGEPMTMPPAGKPAGKSSNWDGDLILFGLFAVMAVVHMLQSVLGRLLGSAVVGTVVGVIIFFLASLGVALAAGVIVFLVSLFLGPLAGDIWSSGGGYSRGGGGSSSGGGFSGGGGGFSGGGSSGSW